jgi:hypothetical protein
MNCIPPAWLSEIRATKQAIGRWIKIQMAEIDRLKKMKKNQVHEG